jgi:hypothetical protein
MMRRTIIAVLCGFIANIALQEAGLPLVGRIAVFASLIAAAMILTIIINRLQNGGGE